MDLQLDRDLQNQAQRWRLHLDQTPLAVIEWDLEGRVRTWNPAAEHMFGYSAQEAIGQPIIDLIVPSKAEIRDQVQHIADGLTQTGQASRAEHENRRKDGSHILCRWFNTQLKDEQGRPLGVASMALDVTEVQRANQALLASEQRFRAVADHTHDWEYWTAPDGKILWMSPSCERITGYPAEAFQQHPDLIFEICHPEDRARLMDHSRTSTGSHDAAALDFRLRHRDGRELWICHFCVGVRDGQGRPLGRRIANREITERKNAEVALHDSEQRFRTIFERAIDGIVLFSLEGRILAVNDAYARMHGRTRETLVGQGVWDLNSPESNRLVPERMRRLLAGETLTIELKLKGQDGGSFMTEATASLVTYAGEPAILSFHRDITARKRIGATLLHHEAMLARTESLAQIGSWEWEVATDTVVWSEEMFRILGRDPAEGTLAYADHFKLYPPQDLARLQQAVEAAINEGEPYELELRAKRPSGEVRICLGRGFPQVGGDGKVGRLYGTLQDITERKRAERSLLESEERLRLALDATSDGVWDWEVATGKTYYSPIYTRMLGYEVDEFATQITSWSDLIHPEDRARVLAANEACIQGACDSFEVEFRMETRGGPWKWIRGRGKAITRDGKGRALRILGTHQDITEKKLAEELLRTNEERFRQISSSMMDVAYSCIQEPGKGFAIDWMTGATEALFGRSLEEVKAAHCWGNFVVEEDLPRFMSQVLGLAAGASSTCELRLRKKDGGLTWVQSHAQCEGSAQVQGQHRLFGALVDITGRKLAAEENAKLQAQLQQAQKMESLGTLAGGIAHDMNNVLGAILGLASVNLETQPPGSPAYRSFETIVKAATRGGEVVRSLLSFARQGQEGARVLDLNAILQEEVHLLERTTLSKVRLEMDLEPGLRPMHGDPGALLHAIMNLCVNAVDAMPEEGTLTLRTRNLPDARIEVEVEDTGIGMPQEVQARALEPFFTTKEVGKGTGLGLSMVYTTVRAHRGQMEIQSEPARGTTVRLRFPACDPEAQAETSDALARPGLASSTLKVLLVDDDELIQSSVQALLEALGHTANLASSGEAALAALEGGLVPDAVILDMNMPGLGGAGTLPRLRALLPRVPVLLSTGRADQAALELARAYPEVALLPKPFALKELRQCLERVGQP